MEVKSILVGLVPFAAMVVAEVMDVGLATLSKAAMSEGMSHFVFVVYSNALSSLILVPFSFFINRKKRPPLTFSILCGDNCDAELCIHWCQLQLTYSWFYYGQFSPSFHFFACCYLQDGEVGFEKFKKPYKSHGHFGINIRSIDCNLLQRSFNRRRGANVASSSTIIIFLD